MKKVRLIKILFLTIIFVTILMNSIYAVSGSMSISSKSTNLNVGETTTLTVTANNSMIFYKISSSDSSVVSVNASSGEIDSDAGNSKSASYTLTAKKAGKATITVSTYDASDYDAKSFSATKTVTITVKEPESSNTTNTNTNANNTTNNNTPVQIKSSDATLKSIKVGGKTYSNPGTTIATSNVSASTSSIKITAETNNSKAKVTGTGTKDLVTGTNKFTLKVTAEDGSTKNYTVKVTKLAEENQTPNVIESSSAQSENKEENRLELTLLEIDAVRISPEFKSDVYEYTANFYDYESLNVKAVADNENAKIEITGNENLVEGDNIIYIVVTLNDKTVTYKITANKAAGLTNINYSDEAEKTEEIIPSNETKTKVSFIGSVKDWWKNGGNLVIVFSILWIVIGIALVYAILAYKYSKILREEYGYSFGNNTEEYGYDLDEDIKTSNQEIEEWYTNPENDIENISKAKGRHF